MNVADKKEELKIKLPYVILLPRLRSKNLIRASELKLTSRAKSWCVEIKSKVFLSRCPRFNLANAVLSPRYNISHIRNVRVGRDLGDSPILLSLWSYVTEMSLFGYISLLCEFEIRSGGELAQVT